MFFPPSSSYVSRREPTHYASILLDPTSPVLKYPSPYGRVQADSNVLQMTFAILEEREHRTKRNKQSSWLAHKWTPLVYNKKRGKFTKSIHPLIQFHGFRNNKHKPKFTHNRGERFFFFAFLVANRRRVCTGDDIPIFRFFFFLSALSRRHYWCRRGGARGSRWRHNFFLFFFFERSSWIVCVCVRYFVKKKNNQTLLELPWRGSEDMTKSPEI